MNPHADWARMQLQPRDGFVLSRVDGSASYEEICAVTGLPAEDTLEILRRLKRARLILAPGEATHPPDSGGWSKAPSTGGGRVNEFAGSPSTSGGSKPVRTPKQKGDKPPPPRRSLLEILDDRSKVGDAEIAGAADLDPEFKRRIVRLHRRLGKLAPHELLGLAANAPAAEIKAAYFAASKELHPDRYYGKDLGPLRDKLSEIFARLTDAFDKLQATNVKK